MSSFSVLQFEDNDTNQSVMDAEIDDKNSMVEVDLFFRKPPEITNFELVKTFWIDPKVEISSTKENNSVPDPKTLQPLALQPLQTAEYESGGSSCSHSEDEQLPEEILNEPLDDEVFEEESTTENVETDLLFRQPKNTERELVYTITKGGNINLDELEDEDEDVDVDLWFSEPTDIRFELVYTIPMMEDVSVDSIGGPLEDVPPSEELDNVVEEAAEFTFKPIENDEETETETAEVVTVLEKDKDDEHVGEGSRDFIEKVKLTSNDTFDNFDDDEGEEAFQNAFVKSIETPTLEEDKNEDVDRDNSVSDVLKDAAEKLQIIQNVKRTPSSEYDSETEDFSKETASAPDVLESEGILTQDADESKLPETSKIKASDHAASGNDIFDSEITNYSALTSEKMASQETSAPHDSDYKKEDVEDSSLQGQKGELPEIKNVPEEVNQLENVTDLVLSNELEVQESQAETSDTKVSGDLPQSEHFETSETSIVQVADNIEDPATEDIKAASHITENNDTKQELQASKESEEVEPQKDETVPYIADPANVSENSVHSDESQVDNQSTLKTDAESSFPETESMENVGKMVDKAFEEEASDYPLETENSVQENSNDDDQTDPELPKGEESVFDSQTKEEVSQPIDTEAGKSKDSPSVPDNEDSTILKNEDISETETSQDPTKQKQTIVEKLVSMVENVLPIHADIPNGDVSADEQEINAPGNSEKVQNTDILNNEDVPSSMGTTDSVLIQEMEYTDLLASSKQPETMSSSEETESQEADSSKELIENPNDTLSAAIESTNLNEEHTETSEEENKLSTSVEDDKIEKSENLNDDDGEKAIEAPFEEAEDHKVSDKLEEVPPETHETIEKKKVSKPEQNEDAVLLESSKNEEYIKEKVEEVLNEMKESDTPESDVLQTKNNAVESNYEKLAPEIEKSVSDSQTEEEVDQPIDTKTEDLKESTPVPDTEDSKTLSNKDIAETETSQDSANEAGTIVEKLVSMAESLLPIDAIIPFKNVSADENPINPDVDQVDNQGTLNTDAESSIPETDSMENIGEMVDHAFEKEASDYPLETENSVQENSNDDDQTDSKLPKNEESVSDSQTEEEVNQPIDTKVGESKEATPVPDTEESTVLKNEPILQTETSQDPAVENETIVKKLLSMVENVLPIGDVIPSEDVVTEEQKENKEEAGETEDSPTQHNEESGEIESHLGEENQDTQTKEEPDAATDEQNIEEREMNFKENHHHELENQDLVTVNALGEMTNETLSVDEASPEIIGENPGKNVSETTDMESDAPKNVAKLLNKSAEEIETSQTESHPEAHSKCDPLLVTKEDVAENAIPEISEKKHSEDFPEEVEHYTEAKNPIVKKLVEMVDAPLPVGTVTPEKTDEQSEEVLIEEESSEAEFVPESLERSGGETEIFKRVKRSGSSTENDEQEESFPSENNVALETIEPKDDETLTNASEKEEEETKDTKLVTSFDAEISPPDIEEPVLKSLVQETETVDRTEEIVDKRSDEVKKPETSIVIISEESSAKQDEMSNIDTSSTVKESETSADKSELQVATVEVDVENEPTSPTCNDQKTEKEGESDKLVTSFDAEIFPPDMEKQDEETDNKTKVLADDTVNETENPETPAVVVFEESSSIKKDSDTTSNVEREAEISPDENELKVATVEVGMEHESTSLTLNNLKAEESKEDNMFDTSFDAEIVSPYDIDNVQEDIIAKQSTPPVMEDQSKEDEVSKIETSFDAEILPTPIEEHMLNSDDVTPQAIAATVEKTTIATQESSNTYPQRITDVHFEIPKDHEDYGNDYLPFGTESSKIDSNNLENEREEEDVVAELNFHPIRQWKDEDVISLQSLKSLVAEVGCTTDVEEVFTIPEEKLEDSESTLKILKVVPSEPSLLELDISNDPSVIHVPIPLMEPATRYLEDMVDWIISDAVKEVSEMEVVTESELSEMVPEEMENECPVPEPLADLKLPFEDDEKTPEPENILDEVPEETVSNIVETETVPTIPQRPPRAPKTDLSKSTETSSKSRVRFGPLSIKLGRSYSEEQQKELVESLERPLTVITSTEPKSAEKSSDEAAALSPLSPNTLDEYEHVQMMDMQSVPHSPQEKQEEIEETPMVKQLNQPVGSVEVMKNVKTEEEKKPEKRVLIETKILGPGKSLEFVGDFDEDGSECLDSIGDLSERTIQRFNTSLDDPCFRRDSFSSISSFGDRQKFRTAIENIRQDLLPFQSSVSQYLDPSTNPSQQLLVTNLSMDSPSDLSPNAPPVGFENTAQYLEKLQQEDRPSAEGSIDSSGFEKVDHESLEDFGAPVQDPMQKSVFGSLGTDADDMKPGSQDDGFVFIERNEASEGTIKKKMMSSHHDDVIEKNYFGDDAATAKLLESPIAEEARKLVQDAVESASEYSRHTADDGDEIGRELLDTVEHKIDQAKQPVAETLHKAYDGLGDFVHETVPQAVEDFVKEAEKEMPASPVPEKTETPEPLVDIHDSVDKVHDEINNFLRSGREPTPPLVEADEDVPSDDKPQFGNQTPEEDETTFDRKGPLTIPEEVEKAAAAQKQDEDLDEFDPLVTSNTGAAFGAAVGAAASEALTEEEMFGHQKFETVPRPPTPPKDISDEDVKPSTVNLGPAHHHSHPSSPHHSILKHHGEPWIDFKTVPPCVLDVIYWRDPKKSGIVLSLALLALFILAKYPLLTVITYSLLLALGAAAGFRIFKKVEAQIKKTDSEHPFSEILSHDLSLPQEKVHAQADVLVEHATCIGNTLKKLIFVESPLESIKFGLVLWSLTYVASWFSGCTLAVLALLGAFSVPKVYESNQEAIDPHLATISGHLKNVQNLIDEKLPFLRSAPVAAEEKKDQ